VGTAKIDLVEFSYRWIGIEPLEIQRDHVKVVCRLHNTFFLMDREHPYAMLQNPFARAVERQLISRVPVITSPSPRMARRLINYYHLSDRNVRVINNPADPNFLSRPSSTNSVGRRVLYVGRLSDPLKGVTTLLQAVARIIEKEKDVECVLAGEGGSFIESQIPDRIRAHVHLVGTRSREQLLDLYREADICVVPSWWETSPYACIDPMSLGKPVIASNVGGIPDLIEHGKTGLLVPPGDAAALAEAIISLLTDAGRRRDLGQAAHDYVAARHSLDTIVEDTLKVYQEVMADSR